MPGARPTSFKKGGGFLNQVDGAITGYEFTDEFPGGDGGKRKGKKSDFNPLYFVLSARVDGADEDVTTTMFAGSADDFEITDDGHTLVPVDNDGGLRANSDLAIFINSLVEAGFPETSLPEDSINYEAIIGTRVRFEQRNNDEKTKRLGKRKGKDGKEYNRQDLVVMAVYSLPGTSKPATKGKSAPAVKTKPGAVAPTSRAKVVDAADNDALLELADETLVGIISSRGGTILKGKLSVPTLNALKGNPQRQDVQKLFISDEYLTRENGWGYDATTQELTL